MELEEKTWAKSSYLAKCTVAVVMSENAREGKEEEVEWKVLKEWNQKVYWMLCREKKYFESRRIDFAWFFDEI